MTGRRLIIFSLAVLVAIGTFFYLAMPPEPRYQGRTLSAWIYDYYDSMDFGTKLPNPAAARQASLHAIKEMGTNAIPTLLQWSRATDFPMKRKLNSLLNRQTFISYRFPTAGQKESMAELCFEELGDDALPAVPALIEISRSGDSNRRCRALGCLLAITQKKEIVLPPLLDAFHTSTGTVQWQAAWFLQSSYPDEAEKAGVYQKFPDWKTPVTNTAPTNSPAPNK